MENNNSNPIYSRIGAGILILGLFMGVLNTKFQFFNYIGPIILLIIVVGLEMMVYGLTKVDIKEDKEYQNFLRSFGKIFLFVMPISIILPILGFLIPQFMIMGIIFLIILIFICPIFMLYFYYKTYKHVKKINIKITSEEKRKQRIIAIIIILLGLVLWYIINHIILK